MQSKLSCLREFTKRAANLVELITRQRRRVLEQRLAYVVDAIIVQPEAVAAVGPIDKPLDSVADVLRELLEESFAAAGCDVRSKRNAIRVRLRRERMACAADDAERGCDSGEIRHAVWHERIMAATHSSSSVNGRTMRTSRC